MQSKQYFTKIKNYPHEKSTEPDSRLGFSNFCRHKKGYLKVYFEIASLFFNM